MRCSAVLRYAPTMIRRALVEQGDYSTTESHSVKEFYSSFAYDNLKPVEVPEFNIDLLSFQKEGIGWMLDRERHFYGGIMADHLGMGKTVQMIGLCLAARTGRHADDENAFQLAASKAAGNRILTILRQLQKISLVANCTRINRPGADLVEMMQSVMKLMSQGATESNYQPIREEIDKWLIFAGKLHPSYEKRAKDFLEDEHKRPFEDINSKELRTLVVVPASLMIQWKNEIETKVNESRKLRVYLYYGDMRAITNTELEQYDFVLTTYDTLSNSASSAFFTTRHAKRGEEGFSRSAAGPLFHINWKRIILDEAHMIRHETTVRWRAVRQLQGVRRWAVTATPLHNSIHDLQNLLSFIGVPKLPVLPGSKPTDVLSDPIMQRSIARSLQPSFLRRGPVMMRNGRKEVLVKLPEKHEKVVLGRFTKEESDMYNGILSRSRASMELTGQNDKLFHIFAMMTRLRQACCHRWISQGRAVKVNVCGICKTEASGCVKTKCGHTFCYDCLLQRFRDATGGNEAATRLPCPVCEETITYNSIFKNTVLTSAQRIASFRTLEFELSTKLEMILQSVKDMREKYPNDKMLIFSQFTTFMDVISVAFDRSEISHVRLDGTMALTTRSAVISNFQNNDNIHVMLASKTATGVGLNLTVANHVLVVDPWWNPAIEEQAVHRCYRIGQTKDVYVTRFIIEDTIEQYCYEICQKKKEFGEAVLRAATGTEASMKNAGSKLHDLVSRLQYVDDQSQKKVDTDASPADADPRSWDQLHQTNVEPVEKLKGKQKAAKKQMRISAKTD